MRWELFRVHTRDPQLTGAAGARQPVHQQTVRRRSFVRCSARRSFASARRHPDPVSYKATQKPGTTIGDNQGDPLTVDLSGSTLFVSGDCGPTGQLPCAVGPHVDHHPDTL